MKPYLNLIGSALAKQRVENRKQLEAMAEGLPGPDIYGGTHHKAYFSAL